MAVENASRESTGRPGHRGDDVAVAHTGARGRRVGEDAHDDGTALQVVSATLRFFGRERRRHGADPRGMHLAVLQQILDDFLGAIDRNREADALRLRVDRHVDADDLSFDVQQRTAGVAGIDRGVGLDEVGERARLILRRNRSAERGDDSRRDRAAETERIADGDDALADHEIGRSSDRRGRESLLIDAQHRQIAVGIDAEELRRDLTAAVDVHGDARRAFDDVIVRDDDAVARPDEAGAERLRGVGALAPAEEAERIEEGIDIPSPDRGLGLNVHDRRQHVVRHDHDRRAPRRADRGRNLIGSRSRLHDLRFRNRLTATDAEEKQCDETKHFHEVIHS